MFIKNRLRPPFRTLYQQGVSKQLLKHLLEFLIRHHKAPPFHPLQLASELSLSKFDALNLILQGVLAGVFEMQWEVFCPRCASTVETLTLLPEIPPDATCPMCHSHFENFADQNVEVLISIHPQLVDSPPSFKSHPHEGNYPPTTALELLGIPLFREKFSDQLLTANTSLKIRRVTVVFTDLIQSTALYEQIGDIRAFQLVNDHFQTLFTGIINHQGGIIKTIGDAVMAILPTPREAVEAALHAKRAIRRLLNTYSLPLASGLKIGIHAGPALIVNLNNTFDLFGSTINIGARLVSVCTPTTVAISEEIAQAADVQALLREHALSTETRFVPLKGLQEDFPVVLVNVPGD